MTYQLLHHNLDIDISELFTFNLSITIGVTISNCLNHIHPQESDHHFLL